MTQYVIFGGSGFIGRHLTRFLVNRHAGATVLVADLVRAEGAERFCACDVRAPITITPDPDEEIVIFNLAAVHTTPGHADHEYFTTNILGAENVCDFARRVGAKSIVFASSIAPYGAGEDRKTEACLPMPDTPYGISKLVAEKVHMIWQAQSSDRRLSIVRPGVVFGEGEGGNFTRLYKALASGLFVYPGRRDTLKAAIYVKDLARVMVEMAESPRSSAQLYNCCFADPPRIDAIVAAMQNVTGMRRRVPLLPPWPIKAAAKVLSMPGISALGFHADRVTKLMVSTNIDGSKLARDYPLRFTLYDALQDWWHDCDGRGLE